MPAKAVAQKSAKKALKATKAVKAPRSGDAGKKRRRKRIETFDPAAFLPYYVSSFGLLRRREQDLRWLVSNPFWLPTPLSRLH